jgi:hypothetical protein
MLRKTSRQKTRKRRREFNLEESRGVKRVRRKERREEMLSCCDCELVMI